MFGVGPQELIVIVFLLLIVFGPQKLGGIAKDVGRWVNEARGSIEEFKEELASPGKGEHQDDCRRKEDQMGDLGEREEPPQKEEAQPVEGVSAQTRSRSPR
jgi:Sec-independent protein translocase protein TatA